MLLQGLVCGDAGSTLDGCIAGQSLGSTDGSADMFLPKL